MIAPPIVRRFAALALFIAPAGSVSAQAASGGTSGLFIGGQIVFAPGFEHSYKPGTYSGDGFSHIISPADAKIGTTTLAGGLRGVGGWGFNRYFALLAGFDIMGGKMKYDGGESEGSSQMSIFTGARLNLPNSSNVMPYGFATVGALSLTSKGEVDLYCGTMSGCYNAGSEWNGGYFGFGGGLEIGRKPAENGFFTFDIHMESARANLDCDFGAGEKCETINALRLSAGFVWRYPKR